MKVLRNVIIAFLLTGLFSEAVVAQCETWNNSPRKEEAENAHVLYRGIIKNKQVEEIEQLPQSEFNLLLENFEKAFEIAPAADGQRPTHYVDGRKIYRVLMNRAQSAEEQNKYAELIMKLYDEQMQCYKNEAYLLGRKAYDMFYFPQYGFKKETLNTFLKAIEAGGNQTEYIVMDPVGQLTVYFYQNQQLTKEEARDINLKLTEIADHNIANNARYKQYYETAKTIMLSHFTEIEDEIFDCQYFMDKLVPEYRANPDDLEVIKYVYNKLKFQGCDPSTPVMVELKTKYESMAAEINAQLQAEFLAANPAVAARRLYEEGSFQEAIDKYQEAIQSESDPTKQAEYYFGIASIEFRKLKRYSSARSNALKAASLRSGWGRPYMLIGDMYAATSSSCGDDWNQRLAVIAAIDKYAYARSIDSEVAEEASGRISKYNNALPERSEGFMRGIGEGQSATVQCWIGETVRLRYK